jgi:transcriptional regulator with XRE-family HTH domain
VSQSTTQAVPPPTAPSTLAQALNARIRELLDRERWSQREFAERLGVTQGAVSYLLAEKRRATVLEYYERLAGVFGMPLSVLIADLEHQVGKGNRSIKGAPHAASAPAIIAAATPATEYRIESAVLRAVLQTLVDVHISAADARIDAHIDAHVTAAINEFRRAEQRRGPKPRQAAEKKRPHHPAADRGPGRAPADDGEALSAARPPTARSLRSAG